MLFCVESFSYTACALSLQGECTLHNLYTLFVMSFLHTVAKKKYIKKLCVYGVENR